MNDFLAFLLFSIFTFQSFSQDFQADFAKFCEEGDTAKQIETLTNWEKEDPKNAELFTSYFNYYFLKSKQEFLSLTTEAPAGESLSIQDSTGNAAGYFGSQIGYLQIPFEKAMDKIDEGIKLYPQRLDMRFGKIYALGQSMDWERFTKEVVKTIQHSSKNNNAWTWTNNEKKEDGENFFLTSLQDYQLTLYNTENDDLLVNMREIANEILKYYPNHVPSLSNLSITYLLTSEYDKGIEPLLKAEKIDPIDVIVLGNIAQGYKLKGDVKMAIKYYEKMIEQKDEQSTAFAKQQIERLKK